MVGNTVTASSSFFARSVQSLKSSSHPFHASWILGSAQKSALALTPVSPPAARAACPALNTDRWAGLGWAGPAQAGQFWWLRPFTRFQQHFLGNWLFFPTVTYFVKIRAVVKFSFRCTMGWNFIWGCIYVIFVFCICDFMLDFFVISSYIHA